MLWSTSNIRLTFAPQVSEPIAIFLKQENIGLGLNRLNKSPAWSIIMNTSPIFDGSKTSVWKFFIKTAIYISVFAFTISCSSNQTAEIPDYWEYSPEKWIAFKESIELEWIHDKVDVDRFEIERATVKLEDSEVQEIFKYVKDKNVEMLIKKEGLLKNRENKDVKEGLLKNRENKDVMVVSFNAIEDLSYKDTKKPMPTFGEACFYQVRAMKDSDASEPAEISVILLSKARR